MKKIALVLALLSTSVLANGTDDFAPLQPAHEGLWFDPDVEGVVVQVYPYLESAFVVVNEYAAPEKDYSVLVFQDFNGVARTAFQDRLLGVEDGLPWTFYPVGNTCLQLKLEGPNGVLNLNRIVPSNGLTECYTCPSVAVGPFPPPCRR